MSSKKVQNQKHETSTIDMLKTLIETMMLDLRSVAEEAVDVQDRRRILEREKNAIVVTNDLKTYEKRLVERDVRKRKEREAFLMRLGSEREQAESLARTLDAHRDSQNALHARADDLVVENRRLVAIVSEQKTKMDTLNAHMCAEQRTREETEAALVAAQTMIATLRGRVTKLSRSDRTEDDPERRADDMERVAAECEGLRADNSFFRARIKELESKLRNIEALRQETPGPRRSSVDSLSKRRKPAAQAIPSARVKARRMARCHFFDAPME